MPGMPGMTVIYHIKVYIDLGTQSNHFRWGNLGMPFNAITRRLHMISANYLSFRLKSSSQLSYWYKENKWKFIITQKNIRILIKKISGYCRILLSRCQKCTYKSSLHRIKHVLNCHYVLACMYIYLETHHAITTAY